MQGKVRGYWGGGEGELDKDESGTSFCLIAYEVFWVHGFVARLNQFRLRIAVSSFWMVLGYEQGMSVVSSERLSLV